ncbi:type VI secretion system protein ImpK [Paraburkholderia susongensis]|uniref:Type VI secretion system protein ImpK n=2 Tax=Paraburkholderia susongensis TaxID=1515439 RepID=A0A1X7LLK9_9BURK|nr:type VI secretion system protein ImpK [Paraburkholderia susongensis]
MHDAGYPPSDADEISLAQSVLLDELTLQALPSGQQGEWLREPLQMRFHGLHDGAARVWERIDALLDGVCQDRAALELYGIVLELGFDGGRRDAGACRQRIKSVLNPLARGQATKSISISTETVETTETAVAMTRAVSPSRMYWIAGGAIVAAVAVVLLWLTFDISLDAAADRLSGQSAMQGGLVRESPSS